MPLIEVYCDGSGTDGESAGGYGFVICVDGVKIAEGSGHLSKVTNNVAEVTAAIRGLSYISTTDLPFGATNCVVSGNEENDGPDRTRVVLVSDSQLTLNWATGHYHCKKWHLVPHVIQLRKLFQKLNAETRWVRGHAGDEHNERCDELAKAARQDIDDKGTSSPVPDVG